MQKKEQMQIMALGAVVIIIIGAVLYMNRGKLMTPPSGPAYTSARRQKLPSSDTLKTLVNRPDFKELTTFGDVPVRPGKAGSPDPFTPFQE